MINSGGSWANTIHNNLGYYWYTAYSDPTGAWRIHFNSSNPYILNFTRWYGFPFAQ